MLLATVEHSHSFDGLLPESCAQMSEQLFACVVRVTLLVRQRMVWRVSDASIRIVHVEGVVDYRAEQSFGTERDRLQYVSIVDE